MVKPWKLPETRTSWFDEYIEDMNKKAQQPPTKEELDKLIGHVQQIFDELHVKSIMDS